MSVENLTPGYHSAHKNEHSQRTGMSQEHKEILRGANEKAARPPDMNANDIQNTSPTPSSGESNIIRGVIGILKQCLKIFNNETISTLVTPVIRFLIKIESLVKALGINLGNLFGSTSKIDNNAQEYNAEVDSHSRSFERTYLH